MENMDNDFAYEASYDHTFVEGEGEGAEAWSLKPSATVIVLFENSSVTLSLLLVEKKIRCFRSLSYFFCLKLLLENFEALVRFCAKSSVVID